MQLAGQISKDFFLGILIGTNFLKIRGISGNLRIWSKFWGIFQIIFLIGPIPGQPFVIVSSKP